MHWYLLALVLLPGVLCVDVELDDLVDVMDWGDATTKTDLITEIQMHGCYLNFQRFLNLTVQPGCLDLDNLDAATDEDVQKFCQGRCWLDWAEVLREIKIHCSVPSMDSFMDRLVQTLPPTLTGTSIVREKIREMIESLYSPADLVEKASVYELVCGLEQPALDGSVVPTGGQSSCFAKLTEMEELDIDRVDWSDATKAQEQIKGFCSSCTKDMAMRVAVVAQTDEEAAEGADRILDLHRTLCPKQRHDHGHCFLKWAKLARFGLEARMDEHLCSVFGVKCTGGETCRIGLDRDGEIGPMCVRRKPTSYKEYYDVELEDDDSTAESADHKRAFETLKKGDAAPTCGRCAKWKAIKSHSPPVSDGWCGGNCCAAGGLQHPGCDVSRTADPACECASLTDGDDTDDDDDKDEDGDDSSELGCGRCMKWKAIKSHSPRVSDGWCGMNCCAPGALHHPACDRSRNADPACECASSVKPKGKKKTGGWGWDEEKPDKKKHHKMQKWMKRHGCRRPNPTVRRDRRAIRRILNSLLFKGGKRLTEFCSDNCGQRVLFRFARLLPTLERKRLRRAVKLMCQKKEDGELCGQRLAFPLDVLRQKEESSMDSEMQEYCQHRYVDRLTSLWHVNRQRGFQISDDLREEGDQYQAVCTRSRCHLQYETISPLRMVEFALRVPGGSMDDWDVNVKVSRECATGVPSTSVPVVGVDGSYATAKKKMPKDARCVRITLKQKSTSSDTRLDAGGEASVPACPQTIVDSDRCPEMTPEKPLWYVCLNGDEPTGWGCREGTRFPDCQKQCRKSITRPSVSFVRMHMTPAKECKILRSTCKGGLMCVKGKTLSLPPAWWRRFPRQLRGPCGAPTCQSVKCPEGHKCQMQQMACPSGVGCPDQPVCVDKRSQLAVWPRDHVAVPDKTRLTLVTTRTEHVCYTLGADDTVAEPSCGPLGTCAPGSSKYSYCDGLQITAEKPFLRAVACGGLVGLEHERLSAQYEITTVADYEEPEAKHTTGIPRECLPSAIRRSGVCCPRCKKLLQKLETDSGCCLAAPLEILRVAAPGEQTLLRSTWGNMCGMGKRWFSTSDDDTKVDGCAYRGDTVNQTLVIPADFDSLVKPDLEKFKQKLKADLEEELVPALVEVVKVEAGSVVNTVSMQAQADTGEVTAQFQDALGQGDLALDQTAASTGDTISAVAPSSTNTNAAAPSGSSGGNGGVIAAVVVGLLVAVALVAVGGFLYWKKRTAAGGSTAGTEPLKDNGDVEL